MKRKTCDRMNFYTTESIGKTREITPEGFLLCREVAIARTGQQLYTVEEIPLEDTGNGEIRIDRTPEEVFREETIASFEGKPVTVEHPDEFVTPDNWNKLSVGIVQNVRRGEGIEGDLLIADLLITAADAIEYVNKELPELSAGYEAEYEQTEPGRGLQRNIIGNHVALVERGRAGPRCAIQDKEPSIMKKRSFWDRLMTAVKAKDEEAVKAELEAKDAEAEESEKKEAEKKEECKDAEGETDICARLDKIEAILCKLVPAAEEDGHCDQLDADGEEEKKETADDILEAETAKKIDEGTTYTGDSLKQVIARAEILAPGLATPTGDSLKSKDAAPKLMRKALESAAGTEQGKACIEPFLMGREVKQLTGDALSGVFNGAAELMRVRNNDNGSRSAISTKDFGRATSVADINARNREFWAKNSAR